MHCSLSLEVRRDDGRQTVTCFVRISAVNTSVSPRTCKAEVHRTLLLGIRRWGISSSRSSDGNSSGALPGRVSSSLRRFDRSHWTLAWAFMAKHFQNALPPPHPQMQNHWYQRSLSHPHALEQAFSRLAKPGESLTAVHARSNELFMSLPDQSYPSSAAWSLLTTLPVRGPYSWGLFFKLWKLILIFQRYMFL